MKPEYKELMQDVISKHRAGLSTDNTSQCLAIIQDGAQKNLPAEEIAEQYKELTR